MIRQRTQKRRIFLLCILKISLQRHIQKMLDKTVYILEKFLCQFFNFFSRQKRMIISNFCLKSHDFSKRKDFHEFFELYRAAPTCAVLGLFSIEYLTFEPGSSFCLQCFVLSIGISFLRFQSYPIDGCYCMCKNHQCDINISSLM